MLDGSPDSLTVRDSVACRQRTTGRHPVEHSTRPVFETTLLLNVVFVANYIEAIADDSDMDLFCKMANPVIVFTLVFLLLNLVITTSDPKDN